MQKIIPTILLTSLFWIVVYILVLYKPDNQSACEDVADYSEAIIGQWKPIEEADIELTFSEYGTMRMDEVPIDINYSIEKNVVTLVFGTKEICFKINIYDSGNDTYLEMFDAARLTGTYKKVRQVQQEVANTEQSCSDAVRPESTNSAKPKAPKRKTGNTPPPAKVEQQPSNDKTVITDQTETDATVAVETKNDDTPVADPKVEQSPIVPTPPQPKVDTSNLSVTGVWTPVEGAELPLTITKYGTAIQHAGSLDRRYSYSLSGERLDIGYDENAKAKVYIENNYTYLEIYNSRNFSGKYRLKSKDPKIVADKIAISEYSDIIIGKWKPVFGAKEPLTITKYGTAIQHAGSLDRRYNYSLKGEKLHIGYDDNAKVVLSTDAANTYLEIYNSREFSGLYKKQ